MDLNNVSLKKVFLVALVAGTAWTLGTFLEAIFQFLATNLVLNPLFARLLGQ